MQGEAMMRARTLGLLGLLGMSIACPPTKYPETPCVFECARPATSGLAGGRQISHLVRGVLPPNKAEDATYSFFVYVFFAEKSERTYLHRRVVGHQVMDLFADVVPRAAGPPLTAPAILYVPVRNADLAGIAIEDGDVDAFLDAYDYERALVLRQRIEMETGRPLPRVALIASPWPLLEDFSLDLAQLYIVSLELPSKMIKDRIIGFRDTLLHSTDDIPEADAASRSRGFFEVLIQSGS